MWLIHIALASLALPVSTLILKPSKPEFNKQPGNVSNGQLTEVAKVNISEGQPVIKMKATSKGVCMYDLPPKFNIDIRNSSFNRHVPVPQRIEGVGPLFSGLHDTDQFSLDRVFYDRMQHEATLLLRPEDCRLFYVPYFSQWETSDHGIWVNVDRSHLDSQVLSHLIHMGRFRKPSGVDHFITISRVERDCNVLLGNPDFQHVKKIGIEKMPHGGDSKVFGVPYPAWFRYSKEVEPTKGVPTVVSTATKIGDYGIKCTGLTDHSNMLKEPCVGKPYCTLLQPEKIDGCPVEMMHGTYKCSDSDEEHTFRSISGYKGGHVIVFGCAKGPCWLWGDCHKPVGKDRRGPLAIFVGHARGSEHSRLRAIEHCQYRPQTCVFFDTGTRSFTLNNAMIAKLDALVMSSVFCINPPGDTPTRKGLFDSLLAGCIPVIMDLASLSEYEWYIKDVRAVSVFVPWPVIQLDNSFQLIDYLESLSPEYVRKKQDAIKELAFSLQYSIPDPSRDPNRLDAFDVAVAGLSA